MSGAALLQDTITQSFGPPARARGGARQARQEGEILSAPERRQFVPAAGYGPCRPGPGGAAGQPPWAPPDGRTTERGRGRRSLQVVAGGGVAPPARRRGRDPTHRDRVQVETPQERRSARSCSNVWPRRTAQVVARRRRG